LKIHGTTVDYSKGKKFISIPEVAKYVKEWKKRKKEDIYV
jgi:hypothetical protein